MKTSGLLREVLSKHYKKVGETMINKPSDINRLIKKNPDLVFVGVKNNPIPSKSGDEKLTLVDHLEKNNLRSVAAILLGALLKFLGGLDF